MTAGKCDKCHRPLTRSAGPLGPVCARRENPAAAVPHRSPVLSRRRVSAIPGQTLLDLDEPQENP